MLTVLAEPHAFNDFLTTASCRSLSFCLVSLLFLSPFSLVVSRVGPCGVGVDGHRDLDIKLRGGEARYRVRDLFRGVWPL